MSVTVVTKYATGATLKATIQRASDGFFRRRVEEDWQSNPSYASRTFNLTEGSAEYQGAYFSDPINNLSNQGDPGLVRIYIHDAGDSNRVKEVFEAYIKGNTIVRLDDNLSSRATPAQVNEEMRAVLSADLEIPELTQAPPKNPTFTEAIAALYGAFRNGVFSDATVVRFYNDAGQVVFEAPITPGESSEFRGKLRNVV